MLSFEASGIVQQDNFTCSISEIIIRQPEGDIDEWTIFLENSSVYL
jgi:hypothetical protein